jgi:hypothetical protein
MYLMSSLAFLIGTGYIAGGPEGRIGHPFGEVGATMRFLGPVRARPPSTPVDPLTTLASGTARA